MSATVDTIIDEQRAYADGSNNDFKAFVDQLINASNVSFSNLIDDVSAGHVAIDVITDALGQVVGSFPDIPTVVYPNYQVPAFPDIDLETIETDITTLEAGRSELLSDIQSGDYGIQTDDEGQLVDRTRERAVGQANTQIESLERSYSNRRFSKPPGTLYGELERANEGVTNAVAEVNREVFIERTRLFLQARQFAISASATIDRARADIQELEYRVQEARARFAIASFQGQLDVYKSEVAYAIERANTVVRVYEAQASVANVRVGAALNVAKVTIANYDSNIRAFISVLDHNLKKELNSLEAFKSEKDLNLRAAQTGADVFASIISGAMSGINTVVTQSKEE